MITIQDALTALHCCAPSNVNEKQCYNCLFKDTHPDCHAKLVECVTDAVTTEIARNERIIAEIHRLEGELANLCTR